LRLQLCIQEVSIKKYTVNARIDVLCNSHCSYYHTELYIWFYYGEQVKKNLLYHLL